MTQFHNTVALSNNKQMQYSHVINPREIVAWVLVVILVVLFIVSIVIIGLLAVMVYMYRRRNKSNDSSPDCALAMDSNPCYEASNVKQTEAQEAGHVYKTYFSKP